MEKKTFDLCVEVLRRFQKERVLGSFILIGSWCVYFYQNYFQSKDYSTFIRTKDIDFLIPLPHVFRKEIRLFNLVQDLGFLERYTGSKGYLKFDHPDLTIEFLVPERGRGSDKPYDIPQLGINAVELRYLDFLVANTIRLKVEGLDIQLPHPAAYALHKFIIFKRRRKIDKHDRDIEGALRVFAELMRQERLEEIMHIFRKMNKKWQQTVLSNLTSIDELEIIDVLRQK